MTNIAGSRWVITGAAGTIGSALRAALTDLRVELVSTDVRPTAPVGAGDSVVTMGLADLESLVELFAGADGVIYLGGIADEADFHDLADVNIDAVRAFLAAMTTEETAAVFYAVSANSDRWWNLDAGEAVGYIPTDDAGQWGEREQIDPSRPQGGLYATPAYSVDAMRR